MSYLIAGLIDYKGNMEVDARLSKHNKIIERKSVREGDKGGELCEEEGNK